MKKIVLQNISGQTVRVFGDMPQNFDIVLRLDTHRICATASVQDLKDQGIPFRKITSINTTLLTERGKKIEDFGTIKLTSNVVRTSKSVPLKSEDNKLYSDLLKKSALTHAVVIAFILSLGFLFNPENKTKPTEVVIIKPQKRTAQKIKTVSTRLKTKSSKSQKRIAKKVNSKKTRRRNLVKRPTRTKRKNGNQAVSMKSKGALAVLGSLSKSKQKGGVNLNKVSTSFGAGLGGKGGSGGVQTSIYAKGLTAAPTGRGGRVQGAGGYGTKGKGGGRGGYGKMAINGASSGYFKPLTSQALVRGGLDRAQVAAVINRHEGQIRHCYEKGLQSKPGLSGRLKMKFTINGRGIVSAANIASSSLKDRTVESCIAKRLRSWKFPKPVGNVNVKVSYPFVLKRINRG